MKNNKSMVDVAFDILSKRKSGLKFEDLFEKVSKECELTDEEKKIKLARFYNNLSLDGRFGFDSKKLVWNLQRKPVEGFDNDDDIEEPEDEDDDEMITNSDDNGDDNGDNDSNDTNNEGGDDFDDDQNNPETDNQ